MKTKKQTKKRKAQHESVEQLAITPIEYGGLQEAYDYFNKALFGGALPDVFITYQRRAHSRGYFSADRFSGRGARFGRHELALNPDTFIDRSDEHICSTLVHEQCHARRHQIKGKSSSYHDKEWAALMKEIGLQPSSTGAVGGKETGHRVSHYIIPDGPFAKAFAKLAASTGWKLNLQSAHRSGKSGGTNSKTRFTCTCGQNAWGKPDLEIRCDLCDSKMKAAA
jgi:predicted SprT family Zn-dependent metalloprotease